MNENEIRVIELPDDVKKDIKLPVEEQRDRFRWLLTATEVNLC